MLHVRAHLMTRQNVNPVHRVPKAWEMLTACVDYLPDVPEHSVYASMGLPKQLAVFMEHADVQTLYHAPWKDIQQLYSTENAAFMQLWAQLFSEHKPPFSSQGCRHQCTSFHWWSGELTANYLAMQVALDFNTERKAGVAFFIVF